MTSGAIPGWRSSPTTGPSKRSRRRCRPGVNRIDGRAELALLVELLEHRGRGHRHRERTACRSEHRRRQELPDWEELQRRERSRDARRRHDRRDQQRLRRRRRGAGHPDLLGPRARQPRLRQLVIEIICGIDWVTANASRLNIKVANMSLGGGGSDDGNCGNTNGDALHKAICSSVAAGVTYVVAAGNDSANMAGFVACGVHEVLAVTAVADFNGQPGGGAAATCRAGVDDTSADFSNSRALKFRRGHTIAAPGVCIYVDLEGRRLQHDLRHQHGVAPRGRHGGTLHRHRTLPRVAVRRYEQANVTTRRCNRQATASPGSAIAPTVIWSTRAPTNPGIHLDPG